MVWSALRSICCAQDDNGMERFAVGVVRSDRLGRGPSTPQVERFALDLLRLG